MALFQFRNFNFGICSDKDAFIKDASSSLPILHFYSKNCFNDVSLAVREFSLAIDFSSWWLTNQNWLSMILSSTWKVESHHFFYFHHFCEISNEKTYKAKVFFLNVWNSFANELWKCWNFAELVFCILLSCQMSHVVWPRLDLTIWLNAIWLFDSHLNGSYRGKLMLIYLATTMNSWVGFVSSIFLYFKLVATLTL